MSNLPSELLHIIARKLKEPTDHIRLQSVCSHWHSAMSLLSMPPPPLPWLFLCFRRDKFSCYFYSFSVDRIYTIPVPDIWLSVDFFKTSSSGWFPASKEKCDDGKYKSLLNLFTGAAIKLPAPHHLPIWYSDNLARQNLMQVSPDCRSIWRVGNASLENCNSLLLAYAESITYYDNCLYIMSQKDFAPIVILDAGTLQIIAEIRVNVWANQYYLAVTAHELYMLTISMGYPLELKVFALVCHAEYQIWQRVTDIGKQVILHDRNRCFLVEAGPSTGLKGNSVYFPELKPCKEGLDGHMNRKYCMTTVDLRDSSCEEVNCWLGSFIISDSWRQYSSAGSYSWIIPTSK